VSQVIVSGTIHDQELLSGENGFSNDRPCATRTSEPNDSDNQVKKKDTQIWHGSSYQGDHSATSRDCQRSPLAETFDHTVKQPYDGTQEWL